MSYIKSKGDATLADIVRFIKETVRAVCGCGVQPCVQGIFPDAQTQQG